MALSIPEIPDMNAANDIAVSPRGGKIIPYRSERMAHLKRLRDKGAPIAPAPVIDKYPTIVGSGLSLTHLSGAYRQALYGYRRLYVDALAELIERDPHLYAVIQQRVLTAAGARLVLQPRDKSSKKSVALAKSVQKVIENIECFRQALVTMMFSGIYYGIGGAEVDWDLRYDALKRRQMIIPKRLRFIHSRRLHYTDPMSWDLYIWDQGWIQDAAQRRQMMNQWGLRLEDYPGKFLVFSPQYRGDYPTREGVGRIVGFWSALKTMGARGAAQYVERYAKPWAIATYATTSTGIPRAAEASASNNDVGAANAALRALGTGSLAGATIPDSIKIQLQQIVGSRSAIGHKDWIAICNGEISKGVLGQTDTTDGSGTGSRARAEVMKKGSFQIAQTDCLLLSDGFQMLVDEYVRLNQPADYDLRPILKLVVDPEPDPYGVVKLAAMFASAGAPVDADEVANTIGVKLVNKNDTKARKLVPVKPIPPTLLTPDLYEEAEITEGGQKMPDPNQDPNNQNSDSQGSDSQDDTEEDGASDSNNEDQ